MAEQKFCLKVNPQFELSACEQIKLFKKVGFDGFFTAWDENVGEYSKTAESEGMIYQSLHAPYNYLAYMWINDSEAQKCVDQYLGCVEDCAKYNVPILVIHPYIEFDNRAKPTREGAERFRAVADRAKALGVKIAFENVSGEEYLKLVMDAFCGYDNVGFCWDSGHELCYNQGRDMLSLYGERLCMVHLHDNFGERDLHLLPFDGAHDWEKVMSRLSESGFSGEFVFELDRNNKYNKDDKYMKMSPEEFCAEAFSRARRLAEMRYI